MNKLIVDAVAQSLDKPEFRPSAGPGDINSKIARDAVGRGADAIGPLKGIAKHASNRGQVALAAVLYAAAARLIEEQDGPERASTELARSAMAAERAGHHELAVALFNHSLEVDPNNLEAANRLGQRLHHLAARTDDVDRYRRAMDLLGRVTFVDDYAKLFHGWSTLFVARDDHDPYAEERAVAEIEEALKRWAFSQREDSQRQRWLRQVRRLSQSGLRQQAESLISFANANARWTKIDPAELDSAPAPDASESGPTSAASETR